MHFTSVVLIRMLPGTVLPVTSLFCFAKNPCVVTLLLALFC